MFLKEGMSLVAEARFHLVVSVQTLQGGPRDVHLAESTSRAEDERQLVIKVWLALKSQIIIPLVIFISLMAPRLAKILHSKETFRPSDSFNLVTSSKILLLHLKQDQIEPRR